MIHKPILLPLTAALALTGTASASTILLTDNFNSESYGASVFNNTLASDQGGTVATVSYSLANYGQDWQIQHGNGGKMMLVGAGGDNSYIGDFYASLNRDFSVDANSYNQPLKLQFDLTVSNASDPSNWATFAVGSAQNVFVVNSANKFSSLFRLSGGTQQFASGGLIGDTATWNAAGSTISFIISDTAGTGSAFNGNGSLAQLYVNDALQGTWSLGQMGVGDGYISFESNGAWGLYDNLSVSVIPEPASATLGILGLGGLMLRRRRA